MYRYYSTKRPIEQGAFPGKPDAIITFYRQQYVPGVGLAWGFLDYSEPLNAETAEHYELVMSKLKKFVVVSASAIL